MNHGCRIVTSGALFASLLFAIGCVPQVSRYRYLSFEEMEGASVETVASVDLQALHFGATIPVVYSIARDHYTLEITIDPERYEPNARIALVDSPGVRLVPRPERGARMDRPRPCGSYDEILDSGESFEFSWVVCDEDVKPEERVVAFDVIADEIGIAREDLRFTLRSDGILWMRDDL